MARKSDYEIMNTSYSTFPGIRKKQEQAYKEAIERKLNKMIKEHASEEEIQKFFNLVYVQEKVLEGGKIKNIQQTFKDVLEESGYDWLAKHLKVPEEYQNIHFGKYSKIPWIKHKQHEDNRYKIAIISKVSKMNGEQILKEYEEFLKSSIGTKGKLDKIRLEAIHNRMDKIYDLARRSKHNPHVSVPASYSEVKLMDHLRYDGVLLYKLSKNAKKRDMQLREELDYAQFISKDPDVIEKVDRDHPSRHKHAVQEALDQYWLDEKGNKGSRYSKRGDKLHDFLINKLEEIKAAEKDKEKRSGGLKREEELKEDGYIQDA